MNKQAPAQPTVTNANLIDRSSVLDLEDDLGNVIAIVRAYESLGIENSKPTVTGNEVAVLMGVILDQLCGIETSMRQLTSRNSKVAHAIPGNH